MLLAVQLSREALGKFGEHKRSVRVARADRRGQLLCVFRALQTSRMLHNSIVHAKA